MAPFTFLPVVDGEAFPSVTRGCVAREEAILHGAAVLRAILGPTRPAAAYVTVFAGEPIRRQICDTADVDGEAEDLTPCEALGAWDWSAEAADLAWTWDS